MKSVTQPKYNPLGGLIRALLAARGLKAFELAERVGVSKQSISKICEVLVSSPEEERALVQDFLKALQALSKLGIERGSGYVPRLKKRMGDLYEEGIITTENL